MDIVTSLIRTADSMEKHGGYPRSHILMREAAETILALREENRELQRKWDGYRKRRARIDRLTSHQRAQ